VCTHQHHHFARGAALHETVAVGAVPLDVVGVAQRLTQ
jgi:hypothetical protein